MDRANCIGQNSEILLLCRITERARRPGYYGSYYIKETPMVIYHCCEGYKLQSGYFNAQYSPCNPICEPPCLNATCTKPGECECWPDYKKKKSSNRACEIVCSLPCVNGVCQKTLNGSTCVCDSGFVPSKEPNKCVPRCSNGCLNGNCVAPEKCSCHDKYVMSPVNASICDPVCSLECIKGICSAPDQCNCYDGYSKGNKWNICDPICSHECDHGDCTAPEECTCWGNYEKIVTNGYKCVPICNESCVNGECVFPNLCSCYDGYEAFNSTSCVPTCTQECINGVCSAPDICTCNEGFVITPSGNTSICVPHCSELCVNGDCTAPDECTCFVGYENTTNPHYCHPQCNETCVNGDCTAPNVCSCKEGYEKFNNTNCVPFCSRGCINGDCTAPDYCRCYEGYFLTKLGICSPHCAVDCFHGNCTAPNVCTCDIDAVKVDPFRCFQTCNDSTQESYCHRYSQSLIEMSSLAIDFEHFEVKIENLTSSFTVPCSKSKQTSQIFDCFADATGSNEEIVLTCSMKTLYYSTKRYIEYYRKWLNETSNFQRLIMKFLRTEDNLCTASLCPNSSRTFTFDNTNWITLCYDIPEVHLQLTETKSNKWLISGLAFLIVSLLAIITIIGTIVYNKLIKEVVYKVGDSCLLNEDAETDLPLSTTNQNQEMSDETAVTSDEESTCRVPEA